MRLLSKLAMVSLLGALAVGCASKPHVCPKPLYTVGLWNETQPMQTRRLHDFPDSECIKYYLFGSTEAFSLCRQEVNPELFGPKPVKSGE